ncbi:hypothetical protein IGI82_003066 [Enterococcus sp. AZ067]|uniref:flavodoxin domain-containing protein n=1 Tax=Enterococcus sp. AZ067 TaxID=2774674 RepID=UPI003F20BDB2
MKNGIIVYQSKYGAVKKYVHWLQDATGFSSLETPKAKITEVMDYDTIIFCGGIYASGIAGLSFLKKNTNQLKDKEILIFCAGASAPEEDVVKKLREQNLTGPLKDIPLFYGRGQWQESKMNFFDRNLVKMLRKAAAKKAPNTYDPQMKALMEANGQDCDWTDKKYLGPLVDYLEQGLFQ